METIAAIATGQSRCAIGIIRLSGDDCFSVCDRVFRAAEMVMYGCGLR